MFIKKYPLLGIKPFMPDELDGKLAEVFSGLVMRKDVTRFMGVICPIPAYVAEHLLGKYCTDLFDEEAVSAGQRLAAQEIADFLTRGHEIGRLQSTVREQGSRTILDKVRVEWDETLGVDVASLENACLHKLTMKPELLARHERLGLSGGWSRIHLTYNYEIGDTDTTSPLEITALQPIQIGQISLEEYLSGREHFTRDEWIDVLVRTMRYETDHTNTKMTQRIKLLYLTRLIPLVEKNYHMVEIGPRETGKSFCLTACGPYTTEVKGGEVTVDKLFASLAHPPRPGLIASCNAIRFDTRCHGEFCAEDEKDLYKMYMENGQINRGTGDVAGDAGFVFHSIIEFNPRDPGTSVLQRHLFELLPDSICDDAAFHDRTCAYLPGWDLPKLIPERLTSHMGFNLSYASEIFHRYLRPISHFGTLWEQWFAVPPDGWSERSRLCVNRTFSGLTKLIFPNGVMEKEDARVLLELAMELRLGVLLQLRVINREEFDTTELIYVDRESGHRHVVKNEAMRWENQEQ